MRISDWSSDVCSSDLAGEIVGQVMLARDELGEWPKGTMAGFGADPEDDDDADDEGGNYTADGRILTNIVMMGMGEPRYNFDEVKGALKIVLDGAGPIGRASRRERVGQYGSNWWVTDNI